jgi:integrase
LEFVPLAEARLKAYQARLALSQGTDPLAAKQAERAAIKAKADALVVEKAKDKTFAEIARAYWELHTSHWKSRAHRESFMRSLELHAFPTIGSLRCDQIIAAQIQAILEPLRSKRSVYFKIARQLELVINHAKALGLREGDNVAELARSLVQKPAGKGKNFPSMPYQQVPAFMVQLAAVQHVSARALEVCILCGLRINEVVQATWAELDLPNKTWSVPAARMKSGRDHRVPLSDRCVEIFKSLVREQGNKYCFISPAGGHISRRAVADLRSRLGCAFSTHGFRGSFRSWAGDCTSFPVDVIEACLAHRLGDAAERAYAKSEFFQKRARLMQMWSAYLARPATATEGSSVVSLRAG